MLKTEQTDKILLLRKKGYGYKSIAGILKISRDDVRSECKKYGLTGYGQPVNVEVIKKQNIQEECLHCGKEINSEDGRGRKSKFCSDKCRRTWWNAHPEKKNKKESAWYSFSCKNCGKEFKAYGNKNRKFCSIRCSSEYRFGSATQDEEVLF